VTAAFGGASAASAPAMFSDGHRSPTPGAHRPEWGLDVTPGSAGQAAVIGRAAETENAPVGRQHPVPLGDDVSGHPDDWRQ
jgi:hypothetical protein